DIEFRSVEYASRQSRTTALYGSFVRDVVVPFSRGEGPLRRMRQVETKGMFALIWLFSEATQTFAPPGQRENCSSSMMPASAP
ncbi:hypothetical protein, partial [Salipiger mangrovisoli]|uniref:hypothetical protein n=1 Tax=Salipiger mangrovisoli TaxID=2865933 RepID=UPI001F11A411